MRAPSVEGYMMLRRLNNPFPRPDPDAARIILYVAAVLMAAHGLALLLFPQVMFTLSEDPGVPANPGWVRWAGGLLSWVRQ